MKTTCFSMLQNMSFYLAFVVHALLDFKIIICPSAYQYFGITPQLK